MLLTFVQVPLLREALGYEPSNAECAKHLKLAQAKAKQIIEQERALYG